MRDWEIYEDKIFQKFSSEFPDCKIIKDMKLMGQFSKTQRQIDVGIIGTLAGFDILGVIECKYFSKKIDVKVIEGFISFLEDVKANFGIVITNEGYSEAAKNWANVKNIRLDILSMDELEDYHFDWEQCQICDPGEDRPPAIVHFDYGYSLERDGVLWLFDLGRCDWCNGINIRCQSCGCITGIPDTMYEKEIECEGGCGIKFIIKEEYVGHGMVEEKLCIIGDEEDVEDDED